MGYVIAVAGKGGTGKTTITALLIRLIKEKKLGSVLAIDADPNSNLGEVLGLKTDITIGSILDSISAHPESLPEGMTKDRFIEYKVQTAIQEAEGFDLLTMGRPEGPGCYCFVNNCLRGVMTKLINDYEYVIIDNEAGLEHLSRRTTRYADVLLVISHATPVSLRAASRIREIVKELNIKTNKNLLLVNCFNEELEKEKLLSLDLTYLGNLAFDEEINKISLDGNSLIKLNKDSATFNRLREIGEKIWA